jgi:hypothetical protein
MDANDGKLIVFLMIGIAIWMVALALLTHFYKKETREWIVGPDYYEMMGMIFVLCIPCGFYDLIKARKMNRNGTALTTIKSVWL